MAAIESLLVMQIPAFCHKRRLGRGLSQSNLGALWPAACDNICEKKWSKIKKWKNDYKPWCSYYSLHLGQWRSHGLFKFVLVVFLLLILLLLLLKNTNELAICKMLCNWNFDCTCWRQLATSTLVDVPGIFSLRFCLDHYILTSPYCYAYVGQVLFSTHIHIHDKCMVCAQLGTCYNC